MLVGEIMNRKVKVIDLNATVKEAAEIMNRHRIGSLIVMENSELKGIITERDLLKTLAGGKEPDTVSVKDIMTKDVIVISPNTDIEDAAEIMTRHKIKKLPVVSKGILVGIVTASDLIAFEDKLLKKLASLMIVSRRTGIAG